MNRAIGVYGFQGHKEVAFEIPATEELLDAVQMAKQISNEFLTRIYESTQESEPVKAKKIESESDEVPD